MMRLLVALLAVAVCPPKIFCDQEIGQKDAKKYLATYGYYNPFVFGNSVEDALKQFQEFAGLPVTGKLDGPTKKQMSMPRCGRPDKDGMNAFRDSKWRKKSLTYRFLRYTRDMDQKSQREAITLGMNLWERVTPLKFTETTGSADITIGFYKRAHGDTGAFDGPGGTLAHAYFPENGMLHFDDDETWSTKSRYGTNLDWVATHEFGHTLGLDHSNIRGTIMYPYYQGYRVDIVLHKDDIRRIQAQYGKYEMCTGNFTESGRPKAGTKCTSDCYIQSGRWGASWCWTAEDKSQWGAECVKCESKTPCYDQRKFCKYWKKYCGKSDHVETLCPKLCGKCT